MQFTQTALINFCPFPSAGQPWHHKADGQRQNSKQATVAEENNHGSVSSTVKDSAFHSAAIDNTIRATCQSRYPVTCAAAENRELEKPNAAVSVGLCTQETTDAVDKEPTVHQHAEAIIPNPNQLPKLSNTTDFANPVFTYRNINTNSAHSNSARSQK